MAYFFLVKDCEEWRSHSNVFLGFPEYKLIIEDIEGDLDNEEWEEDKWSLLLLRTDKRSFKTSMVIETFNLIPTKNYSLN